MNYNSFSYYRANPFASNDFIPVASMTNRKPKQFPSEIPQGQDHLASRPGRRIFKQRQSSEIQRQNILNSPQRYPFQNRIALDKSYRRNLDTIDIQGAASGTKVSESIRNKHKALEELKRRNKDQVTSRSPIIGESLDEVYEKRRRQLAKQVGKSIDMRKTKERFEKQQNAVKSNELQLNKNNNHNQIQRSHNQKIDDNQLLSEYQRYITHNSNQKYPPTISPSQFQGFQRYKRPQATIQTLNSFNNGYIPQNTPTKTIQKQSYQSQRYYSIDNHATTNRAPSTQHSSYQNNNSININNRHRSNPQYIDKYPLQFEKRVEEVEKNKQLQEGIRKNYVNDRRELRRNNPTNLSFNIAARSSLMGVIV